MRKFVSIYVDAQQGSETFSLPQEIKKGFRKTTIMLSNKKLSLEHLQHFK